MTRSVFEPFCGECNETISMAERNAYGQRCKACFDNEVANYFAKMIETAMPVVMPTIRPNQSYMLRWNSEEQKVELTIVDRDSAPRT